MQFDSYRPGPPLAEFVDSMWQMTNQGLRPSRHRICPTGSSALVIHLADSHLSFFDRGRRHSVRIPLLAGPYSRSFLIDPSELTAVIGVRFRPGAGRIFFPVPAHELHNLHVPLDELFPGEGARLLDRLLFAGTSERRFGILERYLAGKLADATFPDAAVQHAVVAFLRRAGVCAIG